MSSTFEFIFVDASGKTKPIHRTRVRSRCNQGKNKREGSRRSVQEARRSDKSMERAQDAIKIPPAPPSDLELVQFADAVGPRSREMLFKTFTCKTLSKAMSPLERCVDFPEVETVSFDWLFHDASFLHALISTSSIMNDFAASGKQRPGLRTFKHLRRTIVLLNEELSKPDAHRRDSTLYVVITLATLAAISGDWSAAGSHITGLHKIVQLRGGTTYLQGRPKLHFKLDRIDIACVLSSGEQPHFLPDTTSWERWFPRRGVVTNPNSYSTDDLVDDRLVGVFCDLRQLTQSLNEYSLREDRWKGASFQAVINSIQVRLLQLPGYDEDPPSECLRLGMLALLTTTFAIPGTKVPYTNLVDRLRRLCCAISEKPMAKEHSCLYLWLLMVGAVSVLDIENDWYAENWAFATGSPAISWDEARSRLLDIMWIECIHDDCGRKSYEKLASRARHNLTNLQSTADASSKQSTSV